MNRIRGTLTRQRSTPDGTPGKLILESGFACDTLELPWADNARGRSCIIDDTYLAKLGSSATLGGPKHQVYRLEDKHGRSDVLIHNANFAGEVSDGKVTQLHGCIAVGREYGMLRNSKGAMQRGILNSVSTLEALIAHAQGAEIELSCTWAEGCKP